MKSQASVEYLIILGIALVLLLPVMGLFYASSVDSKNTANSQLTVIAGQAIATNAEKVYYQSAGSRLKLDISFPDNLDSIRTFNNSLIITGLFEGVQTDFVFYTSIPLQLGICSDPNYGVDRLTQGGRKQIFVESCGKNVTIYHLQ